MTQDLSAVDWPVRTQRLAIRPATESDLLRLFEIRSRPEVGQWLTNLPDDVDVFVERWRDPDRLATALAVTFEQHVIGDLHLNIGDAWAQREVAEQARGTQAEMGWVIDPEHAGHGLATEAASALLRVCFEDLGLRRVTALCFADNVASWRIMEKLGMRREQELKRESLHRTGEWLDALGYGLLAEEWRAGS